MVYPNPLTGWLRMLELIIAFSDHSGYGKAKSEIQCSTIYEDSEG
jgi:hypothetical protein